MNSRERLLVVIVAAIAVVGAAFGARRLYVDRAANLAANRKCEQDKLKEARRKFDEAKANELEWKAIGRQTLSTDVMVAKGRFRVELTRVASESGFAVPPTEVRLSSTLPQGKNGLLFLVYQVKGEGTIDQIVGFLHSLYRQPYLVRCKNISLKPVMNKPSSPTAAPTPTGRLTFSISVETPILPSDKRVPKLETAELALDKRVPVERPSFSSVAEYQAISGDLFRPYELVRVVEAGGGSGQSGNEQTGSTTGVTKDPPKPPDSRLVLTRVLSSPRVQQVVLEDPVNKVVPDKRVEVGEALYNGTLIFVHLTGAVSESATDGKRLFHPVGVTLEQAQELSAARNPDVFEALRDLENGVAAGVDAPACGVKRVHDDAAVLLVAAAGLAADEDVGGD